MEGKGVRCPRGLLKEHKEHMVEDEKLWDALRKLRDCLEERCKLFGLAVLEKELLDSVNRAIVGDGHRR